tara:strand:+ start:422 stop:1261 length:840 start_codon:yes stop_codon:yes gene_type:complete
MQELDELRRLLANTTQRFTHYQNLPPSLLRKYGYDLLGEYTPEQLSLDASRLKFLEKHVGLQGLKVTEIGSNLGFFCLQLAETHQAVVTGFEPIESYARASTLMARLLSLPEENCQFISSGVTLSNISFIDNCDLAIELNVMHHAGSLFDCEVVENSGGWLQYATKRLAAIREKARYLYFQTGNMRNGKPLFASEDSIEVVSKILDDSGWSVDTVGMLKDLSTYNLDYESYLMSDIDEIPRYQCRRNPQTDKVEYLNLQTSSKTFLATGLGNRPLWICS